jgi:hypothetical protein
VKENSFALQSRRNSLGRLPPGRQMETPLSKARVLPMWPEDMVGALDQSEGIHRSGITTQVS